MRPSVVQPSDPIQGVLSVASVREKRPQSTTSLQSAKLELAIRTTGRIVIITTCSHVCLDIGEPEATAIWFDAPYFSLIEPASNPD
jgi:hypothetical protein